MENKWIHKLQNFAKKFTIKNDRKLVIYLICVGIASVLWLLNALEKEYTVELSFPVSYTNLPKNKILINDPPNHFTLDVQSYGFTLLRYKLSVAFSPLVFNINDYGGKIMADSSRSNYAFSSRQFRSKIANQLSNELNITGIHPDTIYFKFDQIVTQSKKVVPDVNLQLKKQHFLYDKIKVKPDSVRVHGPKSILDTLKAVETIAQKYKALDQLTQRNVSLKTIKKVDFSPKRVVVQIPVEEYTEKELSVPISIDGMPDSVKVNLFPSEVKLSFLVGLSRFGEISPKDFHASVSYENIKNKDDYLPVTLTMMPPNLKSTSYLPLRIEYLIEK